jgi:outer membrane protein
MDNLRFAQAEREAIEQQLRQTRQRFEVGLTAITDVHEAQARYDLAVSEEIQAKNLLDTALEQLRELTGRTFEEFAKLDGVPLAVPEPTDIDAWVNTALKQNLELLAADAQVEVARQESRRQRFQRYPTLDLEATYGHSENPVFRQDTEDKIISLQLNFPFYQGGLISSRTREAEQLYNQALALLEQQRRATTRQTRDAYLNVTSGIAQVRATRQALESTRTALEATQAGFEVGTRTAVDVLNSQREVYRAERDFARARYDYLLSTLQLKQAAGMLSEEDLQKVNALLQ